MITVERPAIRPIDKSAILPIDKSAIRPIDKSAIRPIDKSATIAIDTSALIAIAFAKPERDQFREALIQARGARISTISVVEARMIAYGRRGPRAVVVLENILRLPVFTVTPPGPEDMEAAFDAFIAFGKGSGHPAALNFGDIFAYALAKTRGLPLLFKGNDFSETDIPSVIPRQPAH